MFSCFKHSKLKNFTIIYVSADALKAEMYLTTKCIVSHNSKWSMDDFLDLLKMIFPDSKTVIVSATRKRNIKVALYLLAPVWISLI